MTPSSSEESRDEQIARLHRAHQEWIDICIELIRTVFQAGAQFTTDELWAGMPRPPEPRVMGAAILEATRQGLIERTGHYRRSKRRECNARPITVWRRL